MRIALLVLLATLLFFPRCSAGMAPAWNTPADSKTASSPDKRRLELLDAQLRFLQKWLKIPGMSAAVIRDDSVIWSRGFGYANVEEKLKATPSTPYEIASLSKIFGATLLMQLVDSGKANLDDPMSKYSADYKTGAVKVRHLLTHTSEGPVPDAAYDYSGDLFENLFDVLVKASGTRYRVLVVRNILEKIGSTGTSPGNDLNAPDADHAMMAKLIGPGHEREYVGILDRLARSYRLYGKGEVVPTFDYRRGLGPSNGIVSTVLDLARLDAAIDRHLFVSPETQERMWTPAGKMNNPDPPPTARRVGPPCRVIS